MTISALLQIVFYLFVLLILVKPLGLFMARVYQRERTFLDPILRPIERWIYKLSGIDPEQEMNWKTYAFALLLFNLLGFFAVYALQRVQGFLPLNPQNLGPVAPDLAFNTAVSFASNTNWQSYGGETTLSYFTQMFGLTVQNFLSAATGMAVLIAFIRGLVRHTTQTIGNFWVDVTRSVLYILLPLSLVLALALVSQGVVQTFHPYQATESQTLALGPAASQVAIKQLGTNGGGFFGVNSAHPFETRLRSRISLRCSASCSSLRH